MKKIVLLIAILARLDCFAQGEGKPFAPIKENGYSLAEAVEIISLDSVVLLPAYVSVLQSLGERDGWISYVPNKKITPGYALGLFDALFEAKISWSIGEVHVARRIGDEISYFDRPSYSDRVNKVPGLEPVAVLSVTAAFGWKDKNGNQFPKRVIMARRCVNSLIDVRTGSFFPTFTARAVVEKKAAVEPKTSVKVDAPSVAEFVAPKHSLRFDGDDTIYKRVVYLIDSDIVVNKNFIYDNKRTRNSNQNQSYPDDQDQPPPQQQQTQTQCCCNGQKKAWNGYGYESAAVNYNNPSTSTVYVQPSSVQYVNGYGYGYNNVNRVIVVSNRHYNNGYNNGYVRREHARRPSSGRRR